MANEMVLGGSFEWPEIIGEQVRGGGAPSLVGRDEAYDILGELMAKSPAFKQYAEKRAASSRAMVAQIPMNKARDWQIDFGPVSGSASTQTTITVSPQVLFRGEKIMATDDGGSKTAGYNTRVGAIFIGQKSQRPANSGTTLTYFFANGALGNGIRWDTCDKALSISVTVSFVTTSTFEMTVFGKAVL